MEISPEKITISELKKRLIDMGVSLDLQNHPKSYYVELYEDALKSQHKLKQSHKQDTILLSKKRKSSSSSPKKSIQESAASQRKFKESAQMRQDEILVQSGRSTRVLNSNQFKTKSLVSFMHKLKHAKQPVVVVCKNNDYLCCEIMVLVFGVSVAGIYYYSNCIPSLGDVKKFAGDYQNFLIFGSVLVFAALFTAAALYLKKIEKERNELAKEIVEEVLKIMKETKRKNITETEVTEHFFSPAGLTMSLFQRDILPLIKHHLYNHPNFALVVGQNNVFSWNLI